MASIGKVLAVDHMQRLAASPQSGNPLFLLAEYFDAQPPTQRRLHELPWQLERAEDWDRLQACLTDLSDRSTSLRLIASSREYELLDYWRALDERGDMARVYREALARYEAQRPKAADLLVRYNRLAHLLRLSGQYGAAVGLLQRALEETEGLAGPNHPDTASSLQALLLAHQAFGAYDEPSDSHGGRWLFVSTRSAHHLDTATSVNALASLLRAKADYAAAAPLFRRAMAIRTRVLGAEHTATVAVANNLAVLAGELGEYEEAEDLFRRVASVYERTFGPEHPETAKSYKPGLPAPPAR